MKRLPKSIRWRLQVWYGAALLVVLSGLGFTTFHLEKERRIRRIDDGLNERISIVVGALRASPQRGPELNIAGALQPVLSQTTFFSPDSGYYFLVWRQAAIPMATSPGAPVGVPKPKITDGPVRTRGDFREAFVLAAPVDCVLVGRSIVSEEAELRKFAAGLAGASLAVLAVGLIGGWWLATRAIRSVEEISDTAVKIAAGDLSQRISTAETDSELGGLASVLNSTFARLETAFAQQTHFTADAAHELRTPVSVVLMQAQNALAIRGLAESHPEAVEALEAIQRATQRMRRLIESLLELARLDAGQEPLRRHPCDLALLSTDAIELLRPVAESRHIQLEAELFPAICQCDAERLAQVLTNLLSNAIEYNNEGGYVRVSTATDRGAATLLVRNSGPGIAPEDLPHIFERFRRADTARTAGHSGLGLAIARAIVQAHGGSIEATSDPGAETVFVVRLPG